MKWMIVFAGVVTAAVGVYIWKMQEAKTPPAAPQAIVAKPEPAQSPDPHYPVSGDAASGGANSKPLPTIDQSDKSLEEEAKELLGKDYLSLLVNQDLIRKIVVTVNSANEKEIQQEFSPFAETPGKLAISKQGSDTLLDPKNTKRYLNNMKMIENLDLNKLAATYKHFYPLFQSAYEELGTKGYFNDVLVKRLDLLTSTPEVKDPIKLVRANVSYHYEDSTIEDLSAAQKTLIRLGPENARVVKKKLHEFRELIVR